LKGTQKIALVVAVTGFFTIVV